MLSLYDNDSSVQVLVLSLYDNDSSVQVLVLSLYDNDSSVLVLRPNDIAKETQFLSWICKMAANNFPK